MAFPTTAVLETFTGALAAPPNANWTRGGGFGAADLQQDGAGLCTPNSATLTAMDYWNPSTYAPPCEAYVTVSTLPTLNKAVSLEILLTTPGGARSGYELQWVWVTGAANDQWKLNRLDAGVRTQLGVTVTGNDLVAGDSFGASLDGSGVLTGYSNTGGTWASILTATDTTYTAAGNIGLGTSARSGDGLKMDNFGGGVTVATGGGVVSKPVVTNGAQRRALRRVHRPGGRLMRSPVWPTPPARQINVVDEADARVQRVRMHRHRRPVILATSRILPAAIQPGRQPRVGLAGKLAGRKRARGWRGATVVLRALSVTTGTPLVRRTILVSDEADCRGQRRRYGARRRTRVMSAPHTTVPVSVRPTIIVAGVQRPRQMLRLRGSTVLRAPVVGKRSRRAIVVVSQRRTARVRFRVRHRLHWETSTLGAAGVPAVVVVGEFDEPSYASGYDTGGLGSGAYDQPNLGVVRV